ncbi:MAG: hypothetical protein C0459_01065 [Chitinophaga sp.]|jgi:hypothetical protein|nr:hypothetical protein [Chitinophaga sp.]
MKKVLLCGIAAGAVVSVLCYGGLYLCIRWFPALFESYMNPLFHSDGSRDVFFYTHAVIICLALSWFWQRFKTMFKGNLFIRGIEFGVVYAIVALLPVMWMIYSAMDVTFIMVLTWFLYGLLQAVAAGIIFAKLNP